MAMAKSAAAACKAAAAAGSPTTKPSASSFLAAALAAPAGPRKGSIEAALAAAAVTAAPVVCSRSSEGDADWVRRGNAASAPPLSPPPSPPRAAPPSCGDGLAARGSVGGTGSQDGDGAAASHRHGPRLGDVGEVGDSRAACCANEVRQGAEALCLRIAPCAGAAGHLGGCAGPDDYHRGVSRALGRPHPGGGHRCNPSESVGSQASAPPAPPPPLPPAATTCSGDGLAAAASVARCDGAGREYNPGLGGAAGAHAPGDASGAAAPCLRIASCTVAAGALGGCTGGGQAQSGFGDEFPNVGLAWRGSAPSRSTTTSIGSQMMAWQLELQSDSCASIHARAQEEWQQAPRIGPPTPWHRHHFLDAEGFCAGPCVSALGGDWHGAPGDGGARWGGHGYSQGPEDGHGRGVVGCDGKLPHPSAGQWRTPHGPAESQGGASVMSSLEAYLPQQRSRQAWDMCSSQHGHVAGSPPTWAGPSHGPGSPRGGGAVYRAASHPAPRSRSGIAACGPVWEQCQPTAGPTAAGPLPPPSAPGVCAHGGPQALEPVASWDRAGPLSQDWSGDNADPTQFGAPLAGAANTGTGFTSSSPSKSHAVGQQQQQWHSPAAAALTAAAAAQANAAAAAAVRTRERLGLRRCSRGSGSCSGGSCG